MIPTWKPRGFTDELSSHSHFRTSLRCTRTLEGIKDPSGRGGDLGTPTVSLKKKTWKIRGKIEDLPVGKPPPCSLRITEKDGKRMPIFATYQVTFNSNNFMHGAGMLTYHKHEANAQLAPNKNNKTSPTEITIPVGWLIPTDPNK